MKRVHLIMLLSFVALALPLSAHHGFQAEFDGSKVVYITGTLTKVDWSNPHIHFYVEAKDKDSDGKAVSWTFEGSATTLVERSGTHRSDLLANVGKTVTVRATPARAVPTRGAAETVKTADGEELVVGGQRYGRGENAEKAEK